ncbi:MAG TPA: MFS transporter [Gaiellaceae bacterium]|nr:MFS transporter [Gaiellaceae bacterium]
MGEEREARAATGPRAAWQVLRRRDFGPYFVGNALSASGTWFHSLAAALLVYRLTGSEFLLGVLAFSQFGAIVVLSPWAGAAADRFDRRRLLLVVQLAAVLLSAGLALLAFLGLANAWVVIGFTLALGVTSALASPAQLALVASLVPRRDLQTAVALNSMTFNVARALGPMLAALCVATLGIPASFAINSLSYLVLAAALLVIHPRPQERAVAPKLRESLELLRRDPRLLGYLLIVAVVGYASDPVNTLAPAFAEEFGRPDTHAGFVIGAFGAGAVTAALVVAGRTAGTRRTIAATLVMLGLGIGAFALSPWLPLGFVFLYVAGFGYLASNTAATTRLQLGVDESQRGRIMALWTVAFLGLRPLASLLDGALASVAGVRVAGVVLALPALAAALVLLSPLGPGGARASRATARARA